ncbi:MAG: NAD(P)H-dependent glycerol-3-phosphate dehydrogenase [Parvibaculales bacterium]
MANQSTIGKQQIGAARIGIVGAGAWGTALACVMAQTAANAETMPVMLWAHEEETAQAINADRQNPVFLPNVDLPRNIKATTQLAALADCAIVLLVVPAQFLRPVLAELAELLADNAMLVLCAKGIERGTLNFMSQVAADYVDTRRIAVLSGPSFAADVARNLPTAVTLAAHDMETAETLAASLGTAHFRPYAANDVIGAEIGGAIKNVLAIACGIVVGRGLGESARAAITARGFVEMTRLGDALGARRDTLTGLSGLGDLILTCASPTSRNFSLGAELGKGRAMADIMAARQSVSEGAMSAEAVQALAARHGLDMPICAAVDAILAGRSTVDEAIAGLLARPLTRE